jgi:methylated-DNA-protein-cysteine methyltransferase related protein
MTPFATAVAVVLANLEPGQVVTYGEVAAEAGFPGSGRGVGSFLRTAQGYPWWRVVGSDGRLLADHEGEQTRRLRAEGVTVDGGRVRPCGAAAQRPGGSRARPVRGA